MRVHATAGETSAKFLMFLRTFRHPEAFDKLGVARSGIPGPAKTPFDALAIRRMLEQVPAEEGFAEIPPMVTLRDLNRGDSIAPRRLALWRLTLEQQLRDILGEVGGLQKPAAALRAKDDLFAAGLTSFATVGVMLAIEDEFDVSFPDELLVRATFRSIDSLSQAIAGLTADAHAA